MPTAVGRSCRHAMWTYLLLQLSERSHADAENVPDGQTTDSRERHKAVQPTSAQNSGQTDSGVSEQRVL